jgi:hypothetical protein
VLGRIEQNRTLKPKATCASVDHLQRHVLSIAHAFAPKFSVSSVPFLVAAVSCMIRDECVGELLKGKRRRVATVPGPSSLKHRLKDQVHVALPADLSCVSA